MMVRKKGSNSRIQESFAARITRGRRDEMRYKKEQREDGEDSEITDQMIAPRAGLASADVGRRRRGVGVERGRWSWDDGGAGMSAGGGSGGGRTGRVQRGEQ